MRERVPRLLQNLPALLCCCRLFVRSLESRDSKTSDVEFLIESNLDTTTRRRRDEDSHRILTTRREALSLYREIVRITALFDWPNEQGIPWRDILRESARKEFEEARYESDPEVINRLLVVGRDAVHQVAEKFMQKHKDFTNFGSGESPNGTSLK